MVPDMVLALSWSLAGLGQPPFDMVSAAECIEDLANNVTGRYPLLDVHRLDS